MSSAATPDDDAIWLVLSNEQTQCALWPVSRPVPEGWQETGVEGTQAECAEYLDAHWRDMRPLCAQ